MTSDKILFLDSKLDLIFMSHKEPSLSAKSMKQEIIQLYSQFCSLEEITSHSSLYLKTTLPPLLDNKYLDTKIHILFIYSTAITELINDTISITRSKFYNATQDLIYKIPYNLIGLRDSFSELGDIDPLNPDSIYVILSKIADRLSNICADASPANLFRPEDVKNFQELAWQDGYIQGKAAATAALSNIKIRAENIDLD